MYLRMMPFLLVEIALDEVAVLHAVRDQFDTSNPTAGKDPALRSDTDPVCES